MAWGRTSLAVLSRPGGYWPTGIGGRGASPAGTGLSLANSSGSFLIAETISGGSPWVSVSAGAAADCVGGAASTSATGRDFISTAGSGSGLDGACGTAVAIGGSGLAALGAAAPEESSTGRGCAATAGGGC